jgi:Cdc6-like AAA superfamily ATPase
MSDIEFQSREFQVGQVFTPGSPVSEKELFAGRIEQIGRILDAISQKGFHAVLYGDRGVGKTSLANVLSSFLKDRGVDVLFPRANCDATDDFTSLWKKVLRELTITETKEGIGFAAEQIHTRKRLIDALPDRLSPDDIKRTLMSISANTMLVVGIDEFDRLADEAAAEQISDTIKALSDGGCPATILLIGVAESVDALVAGHQSIERSLVQIAMPRMSTTEIEQIVTQGLSRLGMEIDQDALHDISSIARSALRYPHACPPHGKICTWS